MVTTPGTCALQNSNQNEVIFGKTRPVPFGHSPLPSVAPLLTLIIAVIGKNYFNFYLTLTLNLDKTFLLYVLNLILN